METRACVQVDLSAVTLTDLARRLGANRWLAWRASLVSGA